MLFFSDFGSGPPQFCFIRKLAEGAVVEGSMEAFNSGRTLLLSVGSVLLNAKQSSFFPSVRSFCCHVCFASDR